MSSVDQSLAGSDQPPRIGRSGDEPKPVWKRLVYTAGFGFIAYFSLILLFFVSLAQAIFVMSTGRRNDEILAFGRNLSAYLTAVIAYVSWASEDKPFPAKPFPQAPAAPDRGL